VPERAGPRFLHVVPGGLDRLQSGCVGKRINELTQKLEGPWAKKDSTADNTPDQAYENPAPLHKFLKWGIT